MVGQRPFNEVVSHLDNEMLEASKQLPAVWPVSYTHLSGEPGYDSSNFWIRGIASFSCLLYTSIQQVIV